MIDCNYAKFVARVAVTPATVLMALCVRAVFSHNVYKSVYTICYIVAYSSGNGLVSSVLT